jgi:hypothetical protein
MQPGFYCDAGISKQCPIGSYCTPGTNAPTLCTTPGAFCPAGSITETGCSPGSYCIDPSSSQPCQPGSFSGGNLMVCSPCPPGFFCGSSAIIPSVCPSGR